MGIALGIGIAAGGLPLFFQPVPKLLLDVHAGTRSCGQRTLKTRPPRRRDSSGWASSWS